MEEGLILPAKISLIAAFAGFVANSLLRDPRPTSTLTSYEQGEAEGQAFVIIAAFSVGIILAVVAFRAVKKRKLSKTNLYAAIGGFLLNLIGFVIAIIPLLAH